MTSFRILASRSLLLLVILFVCVEGALRLTGWVRLAQREWAAQTGARQQEGSLRVLHVGESTTFGLGVEPEQAYPALVASLLREQLSRTSVLSFNRGVPGLTTSAMVRSLPRKLDEIRPDLVVIMAGANDFNERLNGLRSPGESRIPGPLRGVVSNLRLFKVALLAHELSREGVRWEEGEILYYRHGASKNILYEQPREEAKIRRATATLEANLKAMLEACREHGARALLVGYIQAFEENRILKGVARTAGVPYVSTYLDPDQRPAHLFIADGWHPSPTGHRHIAERIVRVLKTEWARPALRSPGSQEKAAGHGPGGELTDRGPSVPTHTPTGRWVAYREGGEP